MVNPQQNMVPLNMNMVSQVQANEDATLSDNLKRVSTQQYQSPVGTPYVINSNQIQFNPHTDQKMLSGGVGQRAINSGHSGNQSMTYYNMLQQQNEKKGHVGNKGMFWQLGSAGSGSHGSNFNSSSSTFPVAPVQKLSDVKNPQKLLSFRFVNRKATKLSEIQYFKNLQELDLSGNLLQEKVGEICTLNYLKRLSLCNNKISEPWPLPSSIEILNMSYNHIKKMPEQVCKGLKNITTLDLSNNKLETLENLCFMQRIKRLLVKNNFVREMAPLKDNNTLFEIDLEGNAIDSHKDFLHFVKNKNDLIVINLHLNPLMVEVQTIEKFNEDLIQKAPELVTQKTQQEVEELKLLLGLTNDQEEGRQKTYPESAKEEETHRVLNLVEELGSCMTFFKNGVLYRNKRVFAKLKHFQLKSKRSASNYSNSSHSIVNNTSMLTNQKQNMTQFSQINMNQAPKDCGSTQDKYSAKLTPPSVPTTGPMRHSHVGLQQS